MSNLWFFIISARQLCRKNIEEVIFNLESPGNCLLFISRKLYLTYVPHGPRPQLFLLYSLIIHSSMNIF